MLQCSVPEGDLHCQCILSIFPASEHQFYLNILVFVNINPFLYTNDQFALYCIPKNQISRFPTYRVKAKRLYCIVFKKKKKKMPRNFFATKFFCHENFFATSFFCHEFFQIVLYCIPKNQISRFPTYRVKVKR